MELDRAVTRSYLLHRFADDLHALIVQRENLEEQPQMATVVRVNIQGTLNRIKNCPVCMAKMVEYENEPMTRACPRGHGDFVITEVVGDGDVVMEFNLYAEEETEVVDISTLDGGNGEGASPQTMLRHE